MALITQQQLNNASTDADSLSAFVNNASGTITTRLGRVIKCLAQLASDVASLGGYVCAARVRGSDGVIVSQAGSVTVSLAAHSAAGRYQLTIPGLTTSGVVAVSLIGGNASAWSISCDTLSAGTCNVWIYQSGAGTNADFSVTVMKL